MRILLFLGLLLINTVASSQVRVRHGLHLPKVNVKKYYGKLRHAYDRSTDKSAAPEAPPSIGSPDDEPFNEYFYIKWSKNRKLDYADFKCTQAPCKPVVTEGEKDLLHAVYPNYQSFYRVLESRRQSDSALGIKNGADVHSQLNKRLDSLYVGHNYSVSVDQNTIFTKQIDSPAASALTVSPVIYSLNETTYYYNIAALFSKYESWMVVKSADILQHEQIHFDIFELHARKLRKQWVTLLKINGQRGSIYDIINQFSPIYEAMYADLEKMQLEFDEQTGFLTSRDESLLMLNAEWERELKQKLDALKEYEKSEGIITLQAAK